MTRLDDTGTEGLAIVPEGAVPDEADAERLDPGSDEPSELDVPVRLDVTGVRDAFVEAFNARDLDGLVGLVSDDVECPDLGGSGPEELAAEVVALWARRPTVWLTTAVVDDAVAAVAWLPDDEAGGWARAALVSMAVEAGEVAVVEICDDCDALDRAEAADPADEPREQGAAWTEWETGAEA